MHFLINNCSNTLRLTNQPGSLLTSVIIYVNTRSMSIIIVNGFARLNI